MAVIIMISMWLTRKADVQVASQGKGLERMKKKNLCRLEEIILTLTMLFLPPHPLSFIFSFNDSRPLTKFGGFSLPLV